MYKAGFSEKVITPTMDVWLCGYAARNKLSCGVHDDLYVKAFYVCDDSGTEVVTITFDVVGIDHITVAEIRDAVRTRCGVQNVTVNATHNHSGPASSNFLVFDTDQVSTEWITFAKKTAVDTVARAIDAAEPIKLFASVCSAPEMTKNRRPNETAADSTLTVLRAEDAYGNVKGLIINYACHCTVLDGNNYLVSADYPGFLYKKLREKYPDSITAFFNGACGNLNIGYSADASALGIDMGDIRTFENAERKADYLIKCMGKAFKGETVLEGRLSYRSAALKLPLKDNMPTKEQLKKSITTYDEKISMCTNEKKRQQLQILRIYDLALLGNISNYVTDGKSYVLAETVLFKLGDVLFITVPGELFCEIGMEIKEVFKNMYRPVVIGYANGYLGYIPTKAALITGGYESETSIYSLSTEQYLIDTMKQAKEGL